MYSLVHRINSCLSHMQDNQTLNKHDRNKMDYLANTASKIKTRIWNEVMDFIFRFWFVLFFHCFIRIHTFAFVTLDRLLDFSRTFSYEANGMWSTFNRQIYIDFSSGDHWIVRTHTCAKKNSFNSILKSKPQNPRPSGAIGRTNVVTIFFSSIYFICGNQSNICQSYSMRFFTQCAPQFYGFKFHRSNAWLLFLRFFSPISQTLWMHNF